jgi:hypothetical protein
MAKKRKMNPRSLANLRPNPHNLVPRPWKPGQSGNPAGRPSFGLSLREWWNQMQGWDEDRLKEVREDESRPAVQRIAARQMILAMTGKSEKFAGEAIDRIADRTEGKPKQSVDVTHDGSIRTIAEGETEANSLLARLTRSLGLQ